MGILMIMIFLFPLFIFVSIKIQKRESIIDEKNEIVKENLSILNKNIKLG